MLTGDRIAALRISGGYSRLDLATKLGVHYTSVWGWERGTKMPRPSKWAAIAEALGVTLAELVSQ